MPVIPFIPAIAGAVGGAVSARGAKKNQEKFNESLYGMNKGQREGLGTSAYNQLQGQYATDPKRFWGTGWSPGQGYPGSGPGGGEGGGGGGGGGGGYGGEGGYSAQGYSAAQAAVERAAMERAKLFQTDMGDEAFQILPSDRIRQNVGGAIGRQMNAQTADRVRRLRDSATLGGYGSGPAAEYMRQAAEREGQANQAEARGAFETEWANQGAGRRAGGLISNTEQGNQNSMFNADAFNRNSMFNAEQGNQVGMFNVGQTNQASQFGAAAANAAAAQAASFAGSAALQSQGEGAAWDRLLVGVDQDNQDRDLKRYGLLNAHNMGWQAPQGGTPQMYQGPGMLGGAISGGMAGYNFGQTIAGMLPRSGGGGGGGSTLGSPGGQFYPRQRY